MISKYQQKTRDLAARCFFNREEKSLTNAQYHQVVNPFGATIEARTHYVGKLLQDGRITEEGYRTFILSDNPNEPIPKLINNG